MRLFRTEKDFAAFQKLLLEAHQRCPLRLLAWCVMGNHWHFVVWPRREGELTDFFRWLAHTHAMRWRVSHGTVGNGHLYQGRFKSFPIQRDEHLLSVCRYVERNALAAGLVRRACDWPHSSLWAREHGEPELRAILSEWPVARPADWGERVDRPLSGEELTRMQASLSRGRPFGDEGWTARAVRRLNLQHTVRPEGRPPRKQKSGKENN